MITDYHIFHAEEGIGDISKFEERMQISRQYYEKMINGKTQLFSQVSNRLDIDSNELMFEECMLIQTNISFGKQEAEQIYYQFLRKNSKDVQTILLLDIFGRIRKIINEEGNFLKLLYNDSTMTSDINRICSVAPMNRLSIDRTYLHTDRLGFRLYEKDTNKLYRSKKDSINIMILGGSFCASVYSLPGESFVEKTEAILSKNHANNKILMYNLSMGGLQQGDNFSHLLQTGLYKEIDIVIWIDGLNELVSGFSSKTIVGENKFIIGRESLSALVNDKCKLLENAHDRVEAYVKERMNYNAILESLGIVTINMLQPINNMENGLMSEANKILAPRYSENAKYYANYSKYADIAENMFKNNKMECVNLNKTIARELEFWDIAHLSPRGEKRMGEYLAKFIEGLTI